MRTRCTTSRKRSTESRSTSAQARWPPRSRGPDLAPGRPMSRPQVRPDLATATELLADHDVVPLVMVLPAGDETPVRLMQRLRGGGHCFLLWSGTLSTG